MPSSSNNAAASFLYGAPPSNHIHQTILPSNQNFHICNGMHYRLRASTATACVWCLLRVTRRLVYRGNQKKADTISSAGIGAAPPHMTLVQGSTLHQCAILCHHYMYCVLGLIFFLGEGGGSTSPKCSPLLGSGILATPQSMVLRASLSGTISPHWISSRGMNNHMYCVLPVPQPRHCQLSATIN